MAKQRKTRTKANHKETDHTSIPHYIAKRLSESTMILALTFSVFLFLALLTFDASPTLSESKNIGGRVGELLADGLYWLLGYVAYLVPVAVSFITFGLCYEHIKLNHEGREIWWFRVLGLFMTLTGATTLLTLLANLPTQYTPFVAGGVVGRIFSVMFSMLVSPQGAVLIAFSMVLVGTTWLTGLSWVWLTEALGRGTVACARWLMGLTESDPIQEDKSAPRLSDEESEAPVIPKIIQEQYSLPIVSVREEERVIDKTPTPLMPEPPAVSAEKVQKPAKPARKSRQLASTISALPALSLLEKGAPSRALGGYTPQMLEHLSRQLEQYLLDFGVHADVVAVHPGPVITRFELQLAAGVKVSKLSGLAKDLARSLSVTSVRVVEVIPGKTVVGLELPNQHREVVRFGDVLEHEVYQNTHSSLPLALGVDIAGHPMVVDLAKMPHLLVAGTTGSGKSVGINAMILSLLFKAGPEDIRLILVDPKMLELSVYDGIPHLLTPVVTDMKEAASALRWSVAEMERRYRLMAELGVRNLQGYNAKVLDALERGEGIPDPTWRDIDGMSEEAPILQNLPYIVVVIDELADMMMVVGKKVEQLIARIAQKARAAGIHLILATQRPSVDVLTGLIKSNIPTRISFQVSSKIDSRTILDQQGAEQLLGHGDMLYLAPGTGAPLRVHGAFVDDKEVHRVADDWRARGEPQYIDEITAMVTEAGEGSGELDEDVEDSDPLYDQAVEFVVQTRKASTSAVQRRFKIGYNRAARLIEEMERTGVVGPLDGGYRDILVSHVHED